MLSQHAVAETNYPNMQSANQKPGKLNMLSQNAVETNHRLGKLDMLSQHTLQKLSCIKEAAKAQNSGQADRATRCTTRETRARGAAEQVATTS